MSGNFLKGAKYLFSGMALLPKPGIRPYVVIPLAINLLLFAGVIYLLFLQFGIWIDQALAALPAWLDFLSWLLWLLFALLILVLLFFAFSLLANLLASPFNGFLAAAVQRQFGRQPVADSGRSLLGEIGHALLRELVKLKYYLPRVLALVLSGFIPLLNLATPILWFVFGAWMLAIQYLDYPMDNNQIGFRDMLRQLKAAPMTTLGFGAATLLATLIPLVNLIVMPAAVIGASLLWSEQLAAAKERPPQPLSRPNPT